MHCIKTISDFESLIKVPFERKKIIYSINSDFFHDGNSHFKLREKQLSIDIDDEQLLYTSLSEFPCGKAGCPAMFSTVHDYEVHYSSIHQIVCIECKRNFPTYNLLDNHITEKHDSFHKVASDKNLASYKCFVEGCGSKFSTVEERNEHVIGLHQYPPDFKFQSLKQSKNNFEAMDTTQCDELAVNVNQAAKVRTKKNAVPQYVCFGRGSQRAFSKKRVQPSRDISMKELEDAL